MPRASVTCEFHVAKSLLDTRVPVSLLPENELSLWKLRVDGWISVDKCVIRVSRVGEFQSGPKVKPLVEPAPSTSLGRREHRFRRATDLSQWIRRPSSQISATRATCSPAEDRRQGAHRSRQGKSSSSFIIIIIIITPFEPFLRTADPFIRQPGRRWRFFFRVRQDFRSSETVARSTTDIPSYRIPAVRHANEGASCSGVPRGNLG